MLVFASTFSSAFDRRNPFSHLDIYRPVVYEYETALRADAKKTFRSGLFGGQGQVDSSALQATASETPAVTSKSHSETMVSNQTSSNLVVEVPRAPTAIPFIPNMCLSKSSRVRNKI